MENSVLVLLCHPLDFLPPSGYADVCVDQPELTWTYSGWSHIEMSEMISSVRITNMIYFSEIKNISCAGFCAGLLHSRRKINNSLPVYA